MKTYQDLLSVEQTDKSRAEFVRDVIKRYQSGDIYRTAKVADEYDRCRNTTAMSYQKMITDVSGRQYVDRLATVHRSCSNFFGIFTTQLAQYLLGNGVKWKSRASDKLGHDFDTRLQQAGKYALVCGVSFGFYNLDHLEVFSPLEFAPIYDEENGALAAGVRFWQIDNTKPLRATLYEIDGYTNYYWQGSTKAAPGGKWHKIDDSVYMLDKQPYKVTIATTESDGEEILAGENYPAFPIVPLWANPHKQSEIVGLREKIDAYDFILNGWEDDLDNAQLYWIISGAGGMDDPDLLRFLDRLRTVKAAAPADGQDVTPVTVNIPVEARETLLQRLEKQLYRDAMIMNPEDIAGGAATATQIRAAYERQNCKADQFEYCVIDFIDGILSIAGIEDTPTFTRSMIVNTQEEVQTVVMAAQYLGSEYTTRKILTLLGDGDQSDKVLRNKLPSDTSVEYARQMLDMGLMKPEEARALITGEDEATAKASLPGMEDMTDEGQDEVE
jgi:hypothetical protein